MLNEKGDKHLQLKIKVTIFKPYTNLNFLGIINYPGIISVRASSVK